MLKAKIHFIHSDWVRLAIYSGSFVTLWWRRRQRRFACVLELFHFQISWRNIGQRLIIFKLLCFCSSMALSFDFKFKAFLLSCLCWKVWLIKHMCKICYCAFVVFITICHGSCESFAKHQYDCSVTMVLVI